LTFLDNRYPDLEGDEARRSVWLVDVPLHQTHRVREALNTGKPFSIEALEPYEIPIVASVLKLYLLELPGMPSKHHQMLAANNIRLFGLFSCLRNYENYLLYTSFGVHGLGSHFCSSKYPQPIATG